MYIIVRPAFAGRSIRSMRMMVNETNIGYRVSEIKKNRQMTSFFFDRLSHMGATTCVVTPVPEGHMGDTTQP